MNQVQSTNKRVKQKVVRSTTATGKPSGGFTDEELVAMKERIQELKAAPHAGEADGESQVLAKLGALVKKAESGT